MNPIRCLALALLSATVPAQTAPELIGLASGSPGRILRQDPATCAARGCPTAMSAPAAGLLGGTAYDATRGAVWVSDGALVQALDPVACRELCPPRPLPSATNARITGLAINESEGVLIAADTAAVITQYRLECPITSVLSRCDASAAIPAGHAIGGVATDDVRDLVFYSSSSFAGAVNPGNTVYIARRSDPCSPLCKFAVPSCGNERLGPVTGLAFDPCAFVVWATDGHHSVGLRLSGVAPCSVQEIQCCTLPLNTGLVGLGLVPSRATAVGQSCTDLGCPSCPSMAHVTSGDPSIGNKSFALDLVDAPRGSRAALWVGGGSCNAPGVRVAPFCGPILVPLIPPPIVINLTTGPGLGCGGGFRVPVPIPLERSLCGGTLSSQCFGICSNLALGTFVSNCLTWTVTGS